MGFVDVRTVTNPKVEDLTDFFFNDIGIYQSLLTYYGIGNNDPPVFKETGCFEFW